MCGTLDDGDVVEDRRHDERETHQHEHKGERLDHALGRSILNQARQRCLRSGGDAGIVDAPGMSAKLRGEPLQIGRALFLRELTRKRHNRFKLMIVE